MNEPGASSVFDGDALDDVGNLLDPVDGRLDDLGDALQLEDVESLEFAGEEPRHRTAVDPVGLALEAVDGVEFRPEIAEGGELGEQRHVGFGTLDQQVAEFKELGQWLGHLMEEEQLARL